MNVLETNLESNIGGFGHRFDIWYQSGKSAGHVNDWRKWRDCVAFVRDNWDDGKLYQIIDGKKVRLANDGVKFVAWL